MKKSIHGLACVFVYLILVMSCEGPQSITIKGKPEVSLSIGSPFAHLDDSDRLEGYVSPPKIREMMSHTGENVEVYDYLYDYLLPVKPETAQTYIVHYPVAEIELEFIDGAPVNLPEHLFPTETEYLLERTYQMNPSLRGFLGKGVVFKEAQGYLYVTNLGEDSTVSLSFSNAENPVPKSMIVDSPLKSLSKEERPEFPKTTEDPFDGEVPEHSVIDAPYIDLTEILNADSTSTLKIQIKIPLSEIHGNVNNKVIHADLIIKLPLIFEVSNPSVLPDYVELEMNGILPQAGDDDFFGRTGNDTDDDIFDYIEYLKIYLTNHRNTILESEDLSILVTSDNTYSALFDLNLPEPFIKLDSDAPYPFSPNFEFLLRKDKGEDYATLKIKRTTPDEPPVFDFYIKVGVKTDLNYTLTP
jgi:hypothetical protein